LPLPFLVVIPERNLLLFLLFCLSFPKGICFCLSVALAFPSVGNDPTAQTNLSRHLEGPAPMSNKPIRFAEEVCFPEPSTRLNPVITMTTDVQTLSQYTLNIEVIEKGRPGIHPTASGNE